MPQRLPSNRSDTPEHTKSSAAIDRMRVPPLIMHQTVAGYQMIMSLRLVAVCSRSNHDALPHLAQRFASVTAAKAVIAFADQVGLSWPENVQVMRPCCPAITHDEFTVALLTDAAVAGRRDIFSGILEGLVRPGQFDLLFERAKAAVAQLP